VERLLLITCQRNSTPLNLSFASGLLFQHCCYWDCGTQVRVCPQADRHAKASRAAIASEAGSAASGLDYAAGVMWSDEQFRAQSQRRFA
jgi:hypothetical protein